MSTTKVSLYLNTMQQVMRKQCFLAILGTTEECCDRINITSTGIAEQYQSKNLGYYIYHSQYDGKRSYKLDGKDVFLYFYNKNDWKVIFVIYAMLFMTTIF